jgi:phosphomevalonate kinase
MIARAPGKVVLSGAYAVLEGAPALVAAVDRYVVADARREAGKVTPEVAEALARRGSTRAPWFDARALRDDARDQKLGLGSSAAILVASLAALELWQEPFLDDAALASRTFPAALTAHRVAQGGGSGIDVAASAFGGVLLFERSTGADALPRVTKVELPEPLFIEVWSSTETASTSGMLSRVAALRETRPSDYAALMRRLTTAAEAASRAASGGAFVDACREQVVGLSDLGERAGAPIFTPGARAFDAAMALDGAVVLPSGAGGGDVVLLVSSAPLGNDEAGRRFGFAHLPLSLGARGVHADRPASREAGRNETTL